MAGGHLKRSSQCSRHTHFQNANTSSAATETQSRTKKTKTKSPEDAVEHFLQSEQSEMTIEPVDGHIDDFEDDPTVWK